MDENEEQERQAEEERRRQEEDRIREQEEETRRREAEERQREEQRNQEQEEKEKAEEDKKYEDSKEGTLEQMNENNGNNFDSQHAVERYKTVKGLYEEIPITQRLFSRLLPNRWTHAGRMRDATNIAERMMEREINGNDLGNSKDPEFKGMTQKQKLLAEYKQNYSNIRKEYNKLSGWQKFIGAILPANWTKAGKLNTDVKMNDMFFRQKQQDYSRLQMHFIKKMEADKLDHPETANKPTEAERKIADEKIKVYCGAVNLKDLKEKNMTLEEYAKNLEKTTQPKEYSAGTTMDEIIKDTTKGATDVKVSTLEEFVKENPEYASEKDLNSEELANNVPEEEIQGKNGQESEKEAEEKGNNVEKNNEKDATQASEDLGENEVDFNPDEAQNSDDFDKENSKETLDLQARLNEDTSQINSSTDFIENDDLEMVNAMQNENERKNNM